MIVMSTETAENVIASLEKRIDFDFPQDKRMRVYIRQVRKSIIDLHGRLQLINDRKSEQEN